MKLYFFVLIIFYAFSSAEGRPGEVNQTTLYKADNGFLCQWCDKGHYLLVPCKTDHGKSMCKPCPPDEFMDKKSNHTTCAQCSRCPNGQEIIAECSSVSDTVCQCPEGSFWLSILGYDGRCYTHKLCRGGLVVVAKGTPLADTKCGNMTSMFNNTIVDTDRSTVEPDQNPENITSVSPVDSSDVPLPDNDIGRVLVVLLVVLSPIVLIGACVLCNNIQKNRQLRYHPVLAMQQSSSV